MPFVLQYSFESLFRSDHYALLDNACREFLFIIDFFMVSGSAAQDLFNAVLGKTLAMFLVGGATSITETYPFATYPCDNSYLENNYEYEHYSVHVSLLMYTSSTNVVDLYYKFRVAVFLFAMADIIITSRV